jgi:hypothetical protein
MSSKYDNHCVCGHHAFNHLLVNDGSGRIACTVEGCGCQSYKDPKIQIHKLKCSATVN